MRAAGEAREVKVGVGALRTTPPLRDLCEFSGGHAAIVCCSNPSLCLHTTDDSSSIEIMTTMRERHASMPPTITEAPAARERSFSAKLSVAAAEHSLMPAARTKRRTDPAHGRRQSRVSRTSHSSSRKNPEGRQLEISNWTCHPWPLSEPPGLWRSSSPPPIAQRRFAPSGAPVSSVPPLICGAAVATLFR